METMQNGSISMKITEKAFLHSACDFAFSLITPEKIKLGDTKHFKTGEYVEINRTFKIASMEDYKLLLSEDGFLVVLDDRYLRINPHTMKFLFGGELTCFGKITNVVERDELPEDIKVAFGTNISKIENKIRIVYAITVAE